MVDKTFIQVSSGNFKWKCIDFSVFSKSQFSGLLEVNNSSIFCENF